MPLATTDVKIIETQTLSSTKNKSSITRLNFQHSHIPCHLLLSLTCASAHSTSQLGIVYLLQQTRPALVQQNAVLSPKPQSGKQYCNYQDRIQPEIAIWLLHVKSTSFNQLFTEYEIVYENRTFGGE